MCLCTLVSVPRIGSVAYRLQLPEDARIHLVFHCSLLKPFHGTPDSHNFAELPDKFINDQPFLTPLAILDYRRSSSAANAPWEVLVQWHGLSPDEDKVILQGPKDDSISEEEAEPQTEVIIANIEVQESEPETGVVTTANTGVHKEKAKRRTIRPPSYLSDYV